MNSQPGIDRSGLVQTLVMFNPDSSLKDLDPNSSVCSNVKKVLKEKLCPAKSEIAGMVGVLKISNFEGKLNLSVEIESVLLPACSGYIPAGFLEREIIKDLRSTFSEFVVLEFSNGYPLDPRESRKLFITVTKIPDL